MSGAVRSAKDVGVAVLRRIGLIYRPVELPAPCAARCAARERILRVSALSQERPLLPSSDHALRALQRSRAA